MKSPEVFVPTIGTRLQDAEKLISAAKASAMPGSYHIAFQLETMALEEIGKSSMTFIDAIDHKAVGGDE
jgi:AbiV family abortive infection protein